MKITMIVWLQFGFSHMLRCMKIEGATGFFIVSKRKNEWAHYLKE
ncbi:hypothetical protein EBGED10_44130 [Bacillus sp. GeD10]|nr:hypothetical protein EBGED10_44130 [Bacillus sp. GeD10]